MTVHPVDLARALAPSQTVLPQGPRTLETALDELAAALAQGRAPLGFERLFAALCAFHGEGIALRRLREALPLDCDCVESGVLSAMANLGLTARPMPTADPARVDPEALPVLFVPDRGVPVVVYRAVDGDATMTVAADGPAVPLGASRLRGRIWSFAAHSEEHPLSAARRVHTKQGFLGALLAGLQRVRGPLIVTSLGSALVGVVLPVFTSATYANVIGLGEMDSLPAFVGGLLLIVALEALFMLERVRILAFVASRLEYLVSTASFERLLRLRPAMSERVSVTDQAARVRTFDSVRDFIVGPAATALLEAPAGIVSLIAVAALGGPVAFVLLGGMIAHLLVFVLLRRPSRVLASIAAEEASQMQRLTIESLEKLGAIRETGMTGIWSDRIAAAVRRQQRAQYRLRLVGALAETLTTVITTACVVGLLFMGVRGAAQGQIGPGALLAIVMLGMRALTPTSVIAMSIQRFEQLKNSVAQLNQLMDLPPERDDERDYTAVRPLKGAISIVSLGFRGVETQPLFAGLDLDVAPGEVIAVAGANGTGKTVLLKLIQGMADAAIGTIRIDGVDLRQLPLDEVRRKIAYVPQSPALFPGSIRDNVRHGNPLASEVELDEVIARVGLADLCAADDAAPHDQLPRPPAETMFRIAFGQALLSGSKIVLIDELPNSLVDGPVGDLMRDLLALRSRDTTVIFVSHRSDVIGLARRVVALRYGQVPMVLSVPDYLARTL